MLRESLENIENYINDFLSTEAYIDNLSIFDNNNIPNIRISINQGKYLNFLVNVSKAKRILEIGTLAGYSTYWLSKDLTQRGKIDTIEISSKYADLAKKNFIKLGISNRINIIVGNAEEIIPKLKCKYDIIFIDADKEKYLEYFMLCLPKTKKKSIIVVDNVLRGGKILNSKNIDDKTNGIINMLNYIKHTNIYSNYFSLTFDKEHVIDGMLTLFKTKKDETQSIY